MSNPNTMRLFWPDYLMNESRTFVIPFGGQLTAMGFGLQASDEITFQVVHVPAVDFDPCECIPANVELPSVAAHFPLKCCGEEIKLTEDNPMVILDAPQATLMRAIRNVGDIDSVIVWATQTKTADVTDRLRGCPCASTDGDSQQ